MTDATPSLYSYLIIVCCIHGIVCICLLCFCFPFVIYNLHREKAASHNFSCMCHKMAALENDNYGFFS